MSNTQFFCVVFSRKLGLEMVHSLMYSVKNATFPGCNASESMEKITEKNMKR